MQTTFLFICLFLMLVSGVAAAMLRSSLKSAIALAMTSVFLSIVLFIMNAPWAALFELSVCAGLVTAIFVSAISMTTKDRRSESNVAEYRKRFAALPFVLILAGVALIAVLVISGFNIDPVKMDLTASAANFKELFWNTRQADILGQIFIVLAGSFAIAILFKESDKA